MQYEKIVNIITNEKAGSDDWLYSSGMGRILNKQDIHISLVKADDKDLGLPKPDSRLKGAYEQAIEDTITYRLYYNDILVEPLRFVKIAGNDAYVPCPYYYSLSRFGGVSATTLERAIGLVINPGISKTEYFGYLESIHIYVDDADRNNAMKEWMSKQ